jgi:hypothetical protein
MPDQWRVGRWRFTPELREHYPVYDEANETVAVVFPVRVGYDEKIGEPVLSPVNADRLVALWNNQRDIITMLKYLATTLDIYDGFLKDRGGRKVVELLERLGETL